MATHSSIPAWRVPWTKEPGSYNPQGCKESDTTERPSTTLSVRIWCFLLGWPELISLSLSLSLCQFSGSLGFHTSSDAQLVLPISPPSHTHLTLIIPVTGISYSISFLWLMY